jgi:hypothetical protein
MTQHTALGIRPAPQRQPGSVDGSSWRVPAALVAVTSIPLIAGSLRLLEVAGGPQLLPVNPRIDAAPTPFVLHVAAAAVYAVAGAFQFPARLRREHRAWMIRAYALAVAAGTQAFTQGIGEGIFGASDLSTGLSVSSGWVINAAVAEWVIRRPEPHGARRARAAAAGS